MTQSSRFLAGVVALLLAAASGCDVAPAPAGDHEDDVGQVRLALTTTPSDVDCLRVLVRSTSGPQEALRRLTVTTGQNTVFVVGGLPLGEVQITTEGFSQSCGNIGTTTAPTWVGDTRTVTLTPGFVPNITISMRRPAQANLAIDFDSNPPAPVIRELALPGAARATRLAVAADGSVVFTARFPGVVGRASFPSTASILAMVGGEPYGVALATNGDIWATRSSSPQVVRLSPSGMTIGQFNLPALGPVRDIAIDAAGVVWVGANNWSQLARIQNGMASFHPVPGNSVLGIAVGTDGNPRISLSQGIGVVSPSGGLLQIIGSPLQPADIIRGTGGDFWFLGVNGQGLGRVQGMGVQPIMVPPGGPEGSLVLRNDGRVWFSQPDLGCLGRVDVMTGVYSFVALPPGTRPLGLALDGQNRLWVADGDNPRLLVVLP